MDKTYANARSFFEAKTTRIESYKAASGKCLSNNNYIIANEALEISELPKMPKNNNKTLVKALKQNNAEHVCAMKDLCAKITRSKEEDQRALQADIEILTGIVMKLVT